MVNFQMLLTLNVMILKIIMSEIIGMHVLLKKKENDNEAVYYEKQIENSNFKIGDQPKKIYKGSTTKFKFNLIRAK